MHIFTYQIGMCSVDEIGGLLTLSVGVEHRRAAFAGAGHVFASIIVGGCDSAEQIAEAVAAHPGVDPLVIGAVLSTYFGAAAIKHLAPESIRGGLVFPLYS